MNGTHRCSSEAEQLYMDMVSTMPVCDVSCALDLRDLARTSPCSNLGEWWLREDSARRQLMRACGETIEGNASDYELFRSWCAVLPRLIGHPLYHESHWELKTFFDCDLTVNEENCDRIWQITAERFLQEAYTPASVLASHGVKRLCLPVTPGDVLLSVGDAMDVRPVFTLGQDRRDWLGCLSASSGVVCSDWESTCEAYRLELDRLGAMGGRLARHTVCLDAFARPHVYGADQALKKMAAGVALDADAKRALDMQLLRFLMQEYARRGWTVELCVTDDTAMDEWLDFAKRDRGWIIPEMILSAASMRDAERMAARCHALREVATVTDGGVVSRDMWSVTSLKDMLRSYAARTALDAYPGLRTHLGGCGGLWQHVQFRRAVCELMAEWRREGVSGQEQALLARICFENACRLT